MQIDVYPMSNVVHLHQIFCGLDRVARYPEVSLRYRTGGPRRYALNVKSLMHISAFAVVAEVSGLRICFETHDSSELVGPLYDQCDVYFKRSFDPVEHASLSKLRPLGVNLDVRAERIEWAPIWRALFFSEGFKRRVRDLGRAIHLPGFFVPTYRDLSSLPEPSSDPKVLFLTRSWDPADAISPAGAQLRSQINQERAQCIHALREAFGPRFCGGFEDSNFSRRHFPDLVAERSSTSKRAYLDQVRKTDICIATMGLHRSTGWKFAEYLALGRAIVCEPNAFDPGPGLAAGTNFMEFHSPDECVEVVGRLALDHALRGQMMMRNAAWYREHGNPESLVARALGEALSLGERVEERAGRHRPTVANASPTG